MRLLLATWTHSVRTRLVPTCARVTVVTRGMGPAVQVSRFILMVHISWLWSQWKSFHLRWIFSLLRCINTLFLSWFLMLNVFLWYQDCFNDKIWPFRRIFLKTMQNKVIFLAKLWGGVKFVKIVASVVRLQPQNALFSSLIVFLMAHYYPIKSTEFPVKIFVPCLIGTERS